MGHTSGGKKVHYTKLLADNARAFGYLDGKRIGKEKDHAKAKAAAPKIQPARVPARG